jgi:NAD(P)-dependent dehydrogenase (short-subunit alcohol dehydrogenase family)
MADGLIAALGGADAVAARNPSGRIGRGEDVAAAAVYLCARSGSHINGAVLPIDGGSHLGLPAAAAPAVLPSKL